MAISPTSELTQTKQDFLDSVLNKIGKQEFSNIAYQNPLKRIIGGFIELATDIEEIYVERSTDIGYDKDGNNSLDKVKPTVSVQYHTNTQDHGYTCTVQKADMRKGFTVQSSLSTMANTIISQLHTGKEVDEYQDCIDTLKSFVNAPVGTKQNVFTVSNVVDESTSKAFIKTIKKNIHKLTDYTDVYSDKKNYANAKDLILFLDSDTEVELQIEHLASAFNMTVAQLNETTKIVIPNMVAKVGAIAVVCHHKCLKIHPTMYEIDSVKNTKGKFFNYHLAIEYLLSYTTWYPHFIIKGE